MTHDMILFLPLLACLAGEAPPPQRTIALTFDDLPNGGPSMPADPLESMTRKLIGALQSAKAPAIGFVNESKLEVEGEQERRIAVLKMWLDAGFPLGNHTYSHPDLNSTSLLIYQEDILKGERVTKQLMEAKGLKLEWFRHPFTHTGVDAQTKENLDAFLRRKGYRIAPFTIENSDFVFQAVYGKALQRGDAALAARVLAEYLSYNDRMTAWFERLSVETLGQEIPQILLVHANHLNADALPDMLERLKQRGYRFVTLDEAAKDHAYGRRDGFVGKSGPSWIHRWAITMGQPNHLRDEPDPPSWIVDLYKEQR